MADSICIYKEKYISQENVFCFVESMGGYIIGSPSSKRGVIEQKEAIIWISYIDNIDLPALCTEFELGFLKEKYNMEPKIMIVIEISTTNRESPNLALEFCLKFMGIHRDTVVMNYQANLFNYDELQKTIIFCEDWLWCEGKN